MSRQDNVETLLVLQPIGVNTGSPDQEGRLVLANGLLIAVLVRVEIPEHSPSTYWFVEAAFGKLQGLHTPLFESLEIASKWMRHHLRY